MIEVAEFTPSEASEAGALEGLPCGIADAGRGKDALNADTRMGSFDESDVATELFDGGNVCFDRLVLDDEKITNQ